MRQFFPKFEKKKSEDICGGGLCASFQLNSSRVNVKAALPHSQKKCNLLLQGVQVVAFTVTAMEQTDAALVGIQFARCQRTMSLTGPGRAVELL